ncbi:ABC-3 protein OS=Tsukamurella paurometabola (strain ATCC 8368 / DSM / CCUG 35730 / CIP 100753/ JCM 10117 / KCTC 9821 / NBRC 16120 / NCIMB 702349 / NCTC 13040) OX=521096 GN=Tpau_0609 PE=3 SV=1 [Tsukamurella paurometabola]|uniref:ABC-3 protein n=1 Tax=Tsukamurella paurometabola (strain ATCC 8368 / DSM 20162 / CCUG 35730 / CIP 100753 / JCM 10117 / KCTC 9821 / NBRC 16120 / NCIMB 702349 / NCTC 13040) TaxID=521096 RepID=D5USW0_TSUPD|nr:metal ABC transporter permease [Tsukamurella paurometabola]ADG77247.1 ABC-3 protein [Tsukamurella paurometabola DSM 20162]SUP43274.1 High-affinity zinc uptake system membrane protein znuB [Tsukamurella paurometabola]
MDRLRHFFDIDLTAELLAQPFVQQALLAAALLAILAGIMGPLIVSRQMAFSVHGTSELSLTGASFALLMGWSVGSGALAGALIAGLLFGLLGVYARERDSVIGVIMSFGLGLSVLFLALYPGRQGTAFALLTGQIVAVGMSGVTLMAITTVVVLVILAFIYRPLLFLSTDPDVAAARGVPAKTLSVVFAMLVGAAAAQGVQIVGALLVMSLLITPAAAAARVTSSPGKATLLSLAFAMTAAVGGIVLSLAPALPVSVFVTSISFLIYVVCRIIGQRGRRGTEAPEEVHDHRHAH